MDLALTILTWTHVALSFLCIASGAVLCVHALSAKLPDRWETVFLASMIATTVTGFLFPFHGFLPSHGVGILSVITLAFALVARYRRRLAGRWRMIFVATSMFTLYLDVFVLVVQLFLKVPSLHAIAPKQTEPPFVVSQLAVLAIFVALTIPAAMRSRSVASVPSNVPVPTT